MVDYTYHGSGKVTVSPSKGQTGGSGMRSSGTYASEQAARSAVASESPSKPVESISRPSEKGTYTDPKIGIPLTQAQAVEKGLIDKPGEFASKAISSGVSAQEVMKQSSPESIKSNLGELELVTSKGVYDPVKAAEAVEKGLVSGYKVQTTEGSQYFYTRGEAEKAVQKSTITQPAQSASLEAKPWMPQLYPSLQAAKDLALEARGYTPYVTIEGTTLYTKESQKINVPVFDNMIPGRQARYGEDIVGVGHMISGAAQTGFESIVNIVPLPVGKEFIKGAGSVITGIPAFASDIIGGSELHLEEVASGKKTLIGGAFQQIGEYGIDMGVGLLELYATNPEKALGATAVMLYGGRGALKGGLTSLREAIPYDIAVRKPIGSIIELGKIYSPKVETLQLEGLIPRTTEIIPATSMMFASKSKGGLSDVYIRPTPELLEQIRTSAITSRPEFVSTQYGSFMKFAIESSRSEKIFPQISGQVKSSSFIENFPIRIEKRLNIYPAELKFAEVPTRLQIPSITYDVDIAAESVRSGSVEYNIFGGIIKGAPERNLVTGIEEFKQLSSAKLKTLEELFPQKTLSSTEKSFKTIFPSTEEVLGRKSLKISKRTNVEFPKIETVNYEKVLTATSIRTKSELKIITEQEFGILPHLQKETFSKTKRQVAVAEREDVVLESLRGMKFPELKFGKESSKSTQLYFKKTSLFKESFDSKTFDNIKAVISIMPTPSHKETRKLVPVFTSRFSEQIFVEPRIFPKTSTVQFPSVETAVKTRTIVTPKSRFDEFENIKIDFQAPKLSLPVFTTGTYPEHRRKKVSRKVRSYVIKNPFSELEDVIATPTKGKKDSFILSEFDLPNFDFIQKRKSTRKK